MRREVALTGGAALAAGLLIGFIMERTPRFLAAAAPPRPEPRPPRAIGRSAAVEAAPAADVLERYRAAAAV
jgi:hypothetical protein